MSRCLSIALVLVFAAFIHADPVNPGEIHVLQAGDKAVTAKPGDIIVARIPNPALPKMVHDLDITASGAAKVVGVVNAADVINGRPAAGSGHIKIYIAVEKDQTCGAVMYSYKDGAGKEYKQKLAIQIESK